MKTPIISIVPIVLCLGLAAGCAKKQPPLWESISNPEVAAQLKSFVAEKEAQAKADGGTMPPDVRRFFDAATRGDWLAVSNAFMDFRKQAGQHELSSQAEEWLHGAKWQAILEIWGALAAFGEGNEKYSMLYANEIISSIPARSIYFAGTEPGELLVMAMQKQNAGTPFFIVSQHGMANAMDLDYLHATYGGKIYTPTVSDLQRCSEDYTNDAVRRLQDHQLKPGEDIKQGANGQVQIGGYMASLEIRARMAKVLFDQNSNREFYVEESFPLEWMRPYLEPHGIILKLNRQPLPALSDEIIQQDRDYWTKLTMPIIGDWLKPDTSIQEVAAFMEKVYAKHNFSGFTGDLRFIENAYSQKMFSKERSSIGGLYEWRARQTKDAVEKKRMNDAADFVFRQAWVLCPDSPETVIQYVNLLIDENRRADAILVAETAAQVGSMKGNDDSMIRELARQLRDPRTIFR